jgi:S-methylmethionine-dependent homocysteine/selenocysteine methylase
VRDTLSSYIDASSFKFLASSHPVRIDIDKSAMKFLFANIKLVDSMHNEPKSHGWIQYKVKTKPNLPLGTQVKNTASIYFDLNPAIRTNTTVNTVIHHNSIKNVSDDVALRIYPNPNSGSFTLETENQNEQTYIITDMLGQIVQEKNITSEKQHIDMSANAVGVYTLMIKAKSGAVRIVKSE